MRKIFFTVLLTTSFSALFAQKLDDVIDKVTKKKYDEAKEKIDKEMADPKNQSNSEAWFYKSKIYYNLAKAKPDDVTLLPVALEAMKKYMQLEEKQPDGKRMIRATFEANETFFNIYTDYFKSGVKYFQAQDYNGAMASFKSALDAFDYLYKYKLTAVAMDTTSTIYAGFAAQNAKQFDEAAKFYDKLIQAKIYDTSYLDAYKFMINYNLDKKDTATAIKYLEISETGFPRYEDLWIEYEIATMGNDRARKITRYKELQSKYPANFIVFINSAVEMYNNTFFGETKGSDYGANQEATKAALEKAMALDPNSSHAAFIMSQFYVNQIYDMEDSLRLVKGTAAADLAKKKAINARMDSKYEDMFVFSQKASDLFAKETKLKTQDKANYRKTVNQLIDYYNRKKQNDKIPPLEEKLKTLK